MKRKLQAKIRTDAGSVDDLLPVWQESLHPQQSEGFRELSAAVLPPPRPGIQRFFALLRMTA